MFSKTIHNLQKDFFGQNKKKSNHRTTIGLNRWTKKSTAISVGNIQRKLNIKFFVLQPRKKNSVENFDC